MARQLKSAKGIEGQRITIGDTVRTVYGWQVNGKTEWTYGEPRRVAFVEMGRRRIFLSAEDGQHIGPANICERVAGAVA